MLPVKIDNQGQEPIYRQISSQIAALIRAGRLTPGQQLPAERELALQLKVARGTIKKAYETLVQQHYIVAARGRGSLVAESSGRHGKSGQSDRTAATTSAAVSINAETFLAPGTHDRPVSRLEQASQIISSSILQLEDLGFAWREMADLFSILLARREEEVSHLAIAAVDCNPEALGIYQSQLAPLTRMTTARFLFSDLREAQDPAAVLASFDLILTTSNHIEELRSLAPAIADKAVPVVVAPSQSTLIALAKLASSSQVGVLYQSRRFFQIISGWVGKSGYNGNLSGIGYLESKSADIEKFVEDKDVLIVPPGFAAQLPSDLLHTVNVFRQRGGQLIDFAYQIERGSLLYLEELIKNLLNRPGKKQ
ncbi:MAG: hypothetical protein CVV42_19220 [Candidatus Riflebacteria bacterium HGW-Riflebacteria-2]|jgi:DNA-binding transcriptional regulator YhcF (GntR family)|nr:MAG: hypothetical protein CVV42_19220 [Candidatus Riflebacteria bacterium HGW-Riflebacteria-2]